MFFRQQTEEDKKVEAASRELYEAAMYGGAAQAAKAIAGGADINGFSWSEYSHYSFLHIACFMGHEPVVSALIRARANLDVADRYYGLTPLETACKRGRLKIAKRLIAAGAGWKARNPVFEAVQSGNLQLVRYLIEEVGCDDDKGDRGGYDLLLKAVETRRVGIPAVMDYLIRERGLHPDAAPNERYPILFAAAGRKESSTMRTILSVPGVRVNFHQQGGHIKLYTPLHEAAQFGVPDTIAHLIAAGADVNARAEYGKTPLHVAATWGQSENIKALLAGGADAFLVDDNGRFPVDKVNQNKYWQSYKALADHMQAVQRAEDVVAA